MRIYIACPWVDRAQARVLAQRLESDGCTITHPWWEYEKDDEVYSEAYLQDCARADYQGVLCADYLLVLNTQVSEGKAVEQGLAMAWGIPILAVGEPSNIFHRLSHKYQWVATVEEAVQVLLQSWQVM